MLIEKTFIANVKRVVDALYLLTPNTVDRILEDPRKLLNSSLLRYIGSQQHDI